MWCHLNRGEGLGFGAEKVTRHLSLAVPPLLLVAAPAATSASLICVRKRLKDTLVKISNDGNEMELNGGGR